MTRWSVIPSVKPKRWWGVRHGCETWTKTRLSSSWSTYQSWSYDAPGGAVQLSMSTFLSFKYVS
jgi:hypothetical protein